MNANSEVINFENVIKIKLCYKNLQSKRSSSHRRAAKQFLELQIEAVHFFLRSHLNVFFFFCLFVCYVVYVSTLNIKIDEGTNFCKRLWLIKNQSAQLITVTYVTQT